jgi:hypothetical protein
LFSETLHKDKAWQWMLCNWLGVASSYACLVVHFSPASAACAKERVAYSIGAKALIFSSFLSFVPHKLVSLGPRLDDGLGVVKFARCHPVHRSTFVFSVKNYSKID